MSELYIRLCHVLSGPELTDAELQNLGVVIHKRRAVLRRLRGEEKRAKLAERFRDDHLGQA
jgi:hypothetical protein